MLAITERNLLPDQRGAIIVPAIVMGALLVGALFFVAAVGDAIIFRTQLQDAADATAFKSAVWHARGMNVVVVLNVMLSAALGIFAVLRVVEVILLILSFIPFVNAAAAPAFRTLTMSFEPKVFKWIDQSLKIISGLQAGVSAAVPWVAFGDAKATPTAADTIWPLSLSLIPPAADATLLRQMQGGKKLTRIPGEKGPAGLPVEPDEFGTLCSKAFLIIPNQIATVTEQIPVIGGELAKVEDAILDDLGRKVLGAGDGIFCQPIQGVLAKLAELLGEKVCGFIEDRSAEKYEEKDAQDKAAAEANGQEPPKPRERPKKQQNQGSCADRLLGQSGLLGQFADKSTFDTTPARVWDPAGNGSPFMHVWTWASATPRLWASDQRGMGIADKGRTPDVGEIKGAVAMAEFYFDCAGPWEEACEWDAPWAPAWTARIRRYRTPQEDLLGIGLAAATEILDDMERSVGEIGGEAVGETFHSLTGLPSEGPVSELVTGWINKLPFMNTLNDAIKNTVSGAREKTGLNELLNPKNITEEDRVH